MIAGLIIEVCFALIAAAMVLALVESYLVISMGVLFMAFGGTQWTKDVAISTVRYTISVGAKLFVLQLLVSIGTGLIQSWVTSFNNITASSLCILVGCSIVMLALVKVLPETMQRIVNGASMAHGSALTGAAAAVAGAAGAVGLELAGGGGMAGSAYRLAAAQLGARDDQGTAPTSRIGRAAALTGYTAKNMAAAPMADIGHRLSGRPSARHGFATWRMAADLENQARLLEEDRQKPKPATENTHRLRETMKRPANAPALDPSGPHSAVYIAARAEWNERYGSYIAQAHAWRLTALAALGVASRRRRRHRLDRGTEPGVPYVVETNRLGDALAIRRADVAAPVDLRLIRAQLARWIAEVRSVYVDVAAEKKLITEAYAMVDRTGAADRELNEWFSQNDPFKRGASDTVAVNVELVLPLSGTTWRIEWREDQRSRGGVLENQQH